MNEQHYFERIEGWLHESLFGTDRHRAAAATSNLLKALRHEDGQDAALIAIGESPSLTRALLPRVWALRVRVIRSRQAARIRMQ